MARFEPVDLQAALRHLRNVPGPMTDLIRHHGPPELRRSRNSFASLTRAIISQQLNGKAADTILSRFLAIYAAEPASRRSRSASPISSQKRRFPRPEQVRQTSVETLRGAGLSRAKAASVRDLAQKYCDGTLVPRRFSSMEPETLRETLTQVRGIGPWSVDMFLIFALLRPDILPVGDLGVRKGMQTYFDLPELPVAGEMETLAAPWQPYRSVASWYMWRLVDAGFPD